MTKDLEEIGIRIIVILKWILLFTIISALGGCLNIII